jgi:hypothetical protein
LRIAWEYHPLVANYARGDIDAQFATTYRLPIPQHAPFTIGYTFENKPHHYLPDVVGTFANGKPFIAEAHPALVFASMNSLVARGIATTRSCVTWMVVTSWK